MWLPDFDQPEMNDALQRRVGEIAHQALQRIVWDRQYLGRWRADEFARAWDACGELMDKGMITDVTQAEAYVRQWMADCQERYDQAAEAIQHAAAAGAQQAAEEIREYQGITHNTTYWMSLPDATGQNPPLGVSIHVRPIGQPPAPPTVTSISPDGNMITLQWEGNATVTPPTELPADAIDQAFKQFAACAEVAADEFREHIRRVAGALGKMTPPAEAQARLLGLLPPDEQPTTITCPTCGTDLDERDRRADGRIKCWHGCPAGEE